MTPSPPGYWPPKPISGQSAPQLLQRDAKNYRIHTVSLLLSQIEVRAMSDIDPLLPALQQALEQAKQEAGLEMTALLVTDITHRRSTLYFVEPGARHSAGVAARDDEPKERGFTVVNPTDCSRRR